MITPTGTDEANSDTDFLGVARLEVGVVNIDMNDCCLSSAELHVHVHVNLIGLK